MASVACCSKTPNSSRFDNSSSLVRFDTAKISVDGTLAATGTPMALSSDWDAGPLSPLGTIEVGKQADFDRDSPVTSN